MPSKNDIINAVNNLDTFLKVNELNGSIVKKNTNGQPFFFTGGFNMVFQLEKQSKRWTFRVWYINLQNLKERFQKISQYITAQKLSYFADFIYDEKGLLVNGEFVDTIRMEWLDGLLLKDYIGKNLHSKQVLLNFAESFLAMCKELHKHKISHGDLQHGNIIIDKNSKIKLIDYDSICVPNIEGQEELITGLKGYQHPSRINSKNKTSLKADYFSELIIYLSIIAIAENPSLWDEYKVEESEILLFSDDDFANIGQSKIYKNLSNGFSNNVKDLLKILTEYLKQSSYLDLKPVELYLIPPEIIKFSLDKYIVISGQKTTLSWEVKNAHKVEIDNKIGKVNTKGSISAFPNQNTIYKLTASGYGDNVSSQETGLTVFPTPIIESLLVPMPDFNLSTPKFIEPSDNFLKLYKSKVSIFNLSRIHKYIKSYVEKRIRL